jgi:hypothetical protein
MCCLLCSWQMEAEEESFLQRANVVRLDHNSIARRSLDHNSLDRGGSSRVRDSLARALYCRLPRYPRSRFLNTFESITNALPRHIANEYSRLTRG